MNSKYENEIEDHLSFLNGTLGEEECYHLIDWSIDWPKEGWEFEPNFVHESYVATDGRKIFLLLEYDYD